MLLLTLAVVVFVLMSLTHSQLFECHCDERNCLDSLQDTEFNDCSGNAEFEMLKSIRDRCTKHPHNKKIDLSRMVYDDRHKVVMCVVPKVSYGYQRRKKKLIRKRQPRKRLMFGCKDIAIERRRTKIVWTLNFFIMQTN